MSRETAVSQTALVAIDLGDDEWMLPRRGVTQWGGPAYCIEEVAR